MSKIEEQLSDYRTLRDSSRKVLLADIEHARATFSAKGLTSRYLGGVAEGAKDVYEVAKVHTVDNRGVIAIVLGAMALWFGREPLLEAMAEDLELSDSGTDGKAPQTDQAAENQPNPEEISSGDKNEN